MSLQQEFALVERSEQYKLPHLRLRELGLHNVPAVPVDLGGMLDTLLKLGLRAKQREQAYQALTKTFTIGGTTARAYSFLFGAQSADAQPAAAREQAQAFLSNAAALSPSHLAATLQKQDEELAHSSNGAAGDPLTMLPLEDPKQFSLSWTTFPNVYALGEEHLDEWAATLDVTQPEKATEAFFPTIAEYGLSYNLLLTQKVPSAEAPPWRELFGTAWTSELDAAADAGLLYVIDLRIYETLEPQHLHGLTRFTPSTVVVMVQDAETKAMTPELIRVAGGPNEPKIFSRQGSTTPSAWVYALQAAKCSLTVYGIWIGHVYQWHIVTAAMQMTMFETLSGSHPVRRLLQPHSSYLIPFDDVLLINWDAAAVPPTSVATGWQYLQLLERYADGRGFFDDDPAATLQRLGITEADFTVDEPWDRYPIVGQLLEIWDATGRYVDTYVDQRVSDRRGRAARRGAPQLDDGVEQRRRRQRPRPARHEHQGGSEARPPQPRLPHHRPRLRPPVAQRRTRAPVRRELPAVPARRHDPRPDGQLRHPGAAAVPAADRPDRPDGPLLLHVPLLAALRAHGADQRSGDAPATSTTR